MTSMDLIAIGYLVVAGVWLWLIHRGDQITQEQIQREIEETMRKRPLRG